jgi:hypothetical protein
MTLKTDMRRKLLYDTVYPDDLPIEIMQEANPLKRISLMITFYIKYSKGKI